MSRSDKERLRVLSLECSDAFWVALGVPIYNPQKENQKKNDLRFFRAALAECAHLSRCYSTR